MFDHLSYVGYNALFCFPFIILIWLRREFVEVLKERWRPIVISTVALTLYGSIIWPIALNLGCWAYGSDKNTGIMLFGLVLLDDVTWRLFISFLFASFVSLSTYYEDRGIDICMRELKGLVRSFTYAFRGFRIIPLERNSTVHVAIAAFVLMEAILFQISTMQWLFVVISISLVLVFEIFNSCVERIVSWPAGGREHMEATLGREATEKRDQDVGLIKDAAASGVLISAIAAGLVGFMIFFQRFLEVLV